MSQQAALSLTEPASGDPIRVLIVDDDIHHRALERDLLDSPEYQIFEADSGAGALDFLSRQDCDVVLLDHRMPGMDGSETCRRIRKDLGLHLLPILMVTGSGDTANLMLGLHSGADDFVRKPYDPAELLARVQSNAKRKRLTDQLDSAESLLFALARMVEAKDGTTGDHCSRLAHTGVVLGKAMGLGHDELVALRRGGVLHDIGKLGIPDSILLKPGKFTPEEWAIMRQHVDIGANIVGELKSMRMTQDIVRYHHERWDGTGYPYGLKGTDIPLLARVFQVVDIYDALSNTRPYKTAFSREEVVAIMQEESDRGWRDPRITAIFLDILTNNPQSLALPTNDRPGPGEALFEMIQNTGAIEWARKEAD